MSRPAGRAPGRALAALAALALAPRPALADDAAPLRAAAHEWFDGERRSGYRWGGAGLLSLGAAGSLYGLGKGDDTARGMAYPLAAFGLLQTAIGVGSLARGRGRDDAFDAQVARSPVEARQSEIARMKAVNGAFLAIELVETAVVVGAASFAATRTRADQGLARGVGLGLAMEGGLMLLLDALAAARAHSYAGKLDALSVSASAAQGVRWLSVQGAF